MAERKSVATYESIIRDLKAKKYAPIYILMGDEPYYIDKIADYIAEVGYSVLTLQQPKYPTSAKATP